MNKTLTAMTLITFLPASAVLAGGGPVAPAGTLAPPQNGLFGNATPPQVQVK